MIFMFVRVCALITEIGAYTVRKGVIFGLLTYFERSEMQMYY
jgi:hypothetical protein